MTCARVLVRDPCSRSLIKSVGGCTTQPLYDPKEWRVLDKIKVVVVRVVAERDEETEREAKQTGTNSWIAVRRRDVVVVRCLGVRRA